MKNTHRLEHTSLFICGFVAGAAVGVWFASAFIFPAIVEGAK